MCTTPKSRSKIILKTKNMEGRKDYFSEVRTDYSVDGFTTVDAWRNTGNEELDDEGKTVAVIHEKTGDVYYIDGCALHSKNCQEAIKEVRERLAKAKPEPEFWNILVGQSEKGATKVRVKCDERELPTICKALTLYEEFMRKTRVACVAKRGNGGDVAFGSYDYMYQGL